MQHGGANQPDICTPCPRLVPEDPQLFLSPRRPIELPAPRWPGCRRTVWVAVSPGCHCRSGPRQVPDSHFSTFLLAVYACAPLRTATPPHQRSPETDRSSTPLLAGEVALRMRTTVWIDKSLIRVWEENKIHKRGRAGRGTPYSENIPAVPRKLNEITAIKLDDFSQKQPILTSDNGWIILVVSTISEDTPTALKARSHVSFTRKSAKTFSRNRINL